MENKRGSSPTARLTLLPEQRQPPLRDGSIQDGFCLAFGHHAQIFQVAKFSFCCHLFSSSFNHFFPPPPTKAQVSLVGRPVPDANHKWGRAHVSKHCGLAIGCPWPAKTRVCCPRSRSLGPSGTNKLLQHRFSTGQKYSCPALEYYPVKLESSHWLLIVAKP